MYWFMKNTLTPVHSQNNELNEQAHAAAYAYAEEVGIRTNNLHTVRISGASSWVYADKEPHGEGNDMPQVAIRVSSAEDPKGLLEEVALTVSLAQQLREPRMRTAASHAGQTAVSGLPVYAPVQNFIAEPRIYDRFVVTASEYLPHPLGSLHAYGVTLGQLQNISEERSDIAGQAPLFSPLAGMRRVFDYITGGDDLPCVSRKFIETTFCSRLQEGETKVEEMLSIYDEKGYPLSIVQEDVTLANARRDSNGNATLIDLSMVRGPAEITLGRPLSQWSQHFRRPKSWANDVRQGYEQASRRPLDPEVLDRALFVSRLGYAAIALGHIMDAAIQGQEPNAWAVYESERRLANFDRSNFTWVSQEAYLRGEAPELDTYYTSYTSQ
jgi:hypothetical protein